MSREIKKIKYCPAGHSSEDFAYSQPKFRSLHWIPYDNFQNINHIADGGHGSVYSAKLKNGIKKDWDFLSQNWEYRLLGRNVALKEIKNSRHDMVEFLKVIRIVNNYEFIAKYYGISKNPSTQNYIIVMYFFIDDDLHNFLIKKFWDLDWITKLDILYSISYCLENLHAKNLIHCDLHSGNLSYSEILLMIDLGLWKQKNDLLLNSNNKNNIIYGLIPYIPPEVLRGNEFTRECDINSFGGIMYEIVTAQRPFSDQAHDTYLIIDICNGIRPKVPDFMLNWIPEWYLDLMYRCWSDDPSERPTADELVELFCDAFEKLSNNIVDNNVMRQLNIANENQKNTSKSQKKELFELFSHSSKLHPQSCYIGRYISTLHGLHDLLEEIKSGKSSDPNLFIILKSNESTTSILELIATGSVPKLKKAKHFKQVFLQADQLLPLEVWVESILAHKYQYECDDSEERKRKITPYFKLKQQGSLHSTSHSLDEYLSKNSTNANKTFKKSIKLHNDDMNIRKNRQLGHALWLTDL
ncbi:hypothetical protein Glove_48g83 [Diversispora epigaea]|uniref:Protein kinase domain-containing protein n=1 Tax=Diversispora epigaea TaxID=1348612 RepID=A0A397JHF6_9GLOM|nr:hypothetical protein Glove_48g83 [Diversispora epigaea]